MRNFCLSALILVTCLASRAQVIYSDTSITLSENNAFVVLDIDAAIDTSRALDFGLRQFVDTLIQGTGPQAIKASGCLLERGQLSARAVGLPVGNTYYPFQIPLDTLIDSSQVYKGIDPIQGFGQLAIKLGDTVLQFDQFAGGVDDGFIGVRFLSNAGDTLSEHFGYIHVAVPADLRSVTIKGFAFEQTPGKGIRAGAGSPLVSLPEWETTRSWDISQQGNFLRLRQAQNSSPAQLSLKLYQLSGRMVYQSTFEAESRTHRLPFSLSAGIYILLAQDAQGQSQTLKIWR